MPMFELDTARHQNPTLNDDVQPDSTPKTNMHGPGHEESIGNFQNPNPNFDNVAGSSREQLFDESVTPTVKENTSDKSLDCTKEVDIEDEAIATILDGLRQAKKGQLNADKLSAESTKDQKRRRLRKGIPSRFTRKSNVKEKSKRVLDEGSTDDDEDVVFVGEKAGIGRKRTGASVDAAKEALNEDTEIDLEELERSAEKKKAAKKGKEKVTVPPVVTTDKTTAGPSTTPASSDDVFVDVEEGVDEDLGAEESHD
ncbi:hypothetical protein LIER_42663 [Lithospermum erythrorhizon]|uniref:Uncharacterized protein n=1 Tax=Lithospermum erythrorhizon TaxID=34254 RepID=A0AAV3NRD6_LITER